MVKNRTAILMLLLVLSLFAGCLHSENDGTAEDNNNMGVSQYSPMAAEITNTPVPSAETVNENEISSYTTTLYNKEENRIHNIKTAAKKLNHTVIGPGDIFSFNDVIGERTKARGYKKASILVDGEKKTGTGGGVCQISSTLYNAALGADMEIVERHKHSKEVPYVPEGKDAAVVYNSKDFRFKNTKDYPVEILITVTEDEVQVTLNKKP